MSAPVVYKPGLVQIRPQYVQEDDKDHPENVLWFLSNTTPGAPAPLSTLVALASVFDPLWANVWKQVGSDNTTYQGSIVSDWYSAAGLSYDSVGIFTPVSGTITTTMPPQVSVLISNKISGRYKGGHGRTYLPWLGHDILVSGSNDTVAPGVISAMQTALTALDTGMAGFTTAPFSTGLLQCVYRHRTNPATAVASPITQQIVQPILATQRRRIRRTPHH